MQTFNEGDTVVLISGGPNMTISILRDNPDGKKAFCKWFDTNKQKFTEEWFFVSALRMVQ